MSQEQPAWSALAAMMDADGLPPRMRRWFKELYGRYRAGATGKLPWDRVAGPQPGDILEWEAIETVENQAQGEAQLEGLVCIVLNGGLGTSMHLDRAKSIISVREDRSFLEMTLQQLRALRRRHGVSVPLLLMNSYRTRQDSLEALSAWSQPHGFPLDFVQHRVPRIDATTHGPLEAEDPEARWAPPGHGDIYEALFLSGLLRDLVAQGYRWAFVSNSDNLGATVAPAVLGHMASEGLEFVMEVTAKTEADRKGGTLVRHEDRLALLERAQVPDEGLGDFEDIRRFQVFNTNSLWWHLPAVLARLDEGPMPLPMIVNPKAAGSRSWVQLEVAMGAAIGCFDQAVGVRVPRSRFAPVKTTADLLAVRSDAYVVDGDWGLRPNPERGALGAVVIHLDPAWFQGLASFDARFPEPPSLVACRRLTVEGDVTFGRDVVIRGEVTVRAPTGHAGCVPDGSVLEDTTLVL